MDKNVQLISSGLFIVILIVIYGQFRCAFPEFKDPLSIHGMVYVDGWLLSHFIVFALAGYFYPKQFYLAVILGILWEITEHLLGINTPRFLKCETQDKSKAKFQYIHKNKDPSLAEKNDAWWYGRYEDVVVDIIGFMTGYFIKTYSF
tara:strand:+ start:367 stop:807 length:441 start_codon:yes stop_codon:yes gene_type:complete